MTDMCHCGKPLHYENKIIRDYMKIMVKQHGEFVTIVVGDKKWKVQRHYIALHGIKADLMHTYGFEEIK